MEAVAWFFRESTEKTWKCVFPTVMHILSKNTLTYLSPSSCFRSQQWRWMDPWRTSTSPWRKLMGLTLYPHHSALSNKAWTRSSRILVAAFSTTSNTFSSSMRKLKNKSKVFCKTGMSGDCSLNVYFFFVEEEEMWRIGCLGGDSPIAPLSPGGNIAASTWTCKPCKSRQA